MPLMPEHKAIIRVDAIESGRTDGRHLDTIPDVIEDVTGSALRAAGITPEIEDSDQFSGDGFMRAYPSRYLPELVDMVPSLDKRVAEHNRWRKPEVRLRVAIHCGPVPKELGYYRPNIDLSRLLDAPVFKKVVNRCRTDITGDAFTTALILSDQAYRTVFSGDFTRIVEPHEFASIQAELSEFRDDAWVRIAGLDVQRIASFALDHTVFEDAVSAEWTPKAFAPDSAGRSISNSGTVNGHQVTGDGNHVQGFTTTNVQNYAGGGNTGIQTGSIHGDVNFGGSR